MSQPWKVIAAFAGIFLAGAVTGGFVAHKWIRPGPPAQPPKARLSMEQFSRTQMELIIKRLSLTEAQREQLKPIISQAHVELRTLNRDVFRQSVQVFEHINAELLKILTPEQKVKFDELRKEQREKFRRHLQQNGFPGRLRNRDDGPPPPHPPEGEDLPPPPAPEPTGKSG